MDFTGKWTNKKDSVLELNQDGNSLTGTFDSGVADGGEVIVPVVGWANGDRVTFAATYEKFGTVVAWTGQVTGEPGNPVIHTHFLHETDIPEAQEGEYLWASTKVGNDQFSKKS
jgi:hypothetical protein